MEAGMRAALLLVLALTACAQGPQPIAQQAAELAAGTPPHPDSLAGQMLRPWRHVSGKTDQKKFDQVQAKCKVIALQTPVGAGSPEIVYLSGLINCLKAEGYEPEPVR
jgi:hypothetical protein